MIIPKNKSHQFRFSDACKSEHVKHMHDSANAMIARIEAAIDLQWSKGNPVYNLEPLILEKGHDINTIAQLKEYDVKVYDFDKRNAELLSAYELDAEWRPCLLTESLMEWVGNYDDKRDIDVLHIGGVFPRRKEIIEKIQAIPCVKFENVVGVYGKDASELMKRAKIVLNIHRDGEQQAQEQLRISWAIACGCLVVSERSIEPSIPNGIIVESEYGHLFDSVLSSLDKWTFADAMKRKNKYLKLSEKYKKEIWKL